MSSSFSSLSPRVSVIMPIFNAREYLPETLASLHAQRWPDLEVIGIDDGSTDGSPELFQELCPGGVLLRQANRGPAHARNAGLARASGEFLTFLDSDDLWPEGKIARQIARLQAEPNLLATLGFIRLFTDEVGSDGARVRQWGQPFFLFLLGGMIARRELFNTARVGDFDAEQFPYNGEDTDWFLRAWEGGQPMEIVEEPTIFYRRRSGSLTHNADDTKRGLAGLMMASLRRRRQSDGRVRPLPNTLRIPQTVIPRA